MVPPRDAHRGFVLAVGKVRAWSARQHGCQRCHDERIGSHSCAARPRCCCCVGATNGFLLRTAQHYDDEKALSEYDRAAVKEAAKFDDRDTSATVDAALAAAGLPGGASGGKPTMAVVCIVACVMGDREEEIGKSFQGDASAMKAALQEIAASANGDEEVFAFELFWVPGEDDEVLDNDEIILDWPELMPC